MQPSHLLFRLGSLLCFHLSLQLLLQLHRLGVLLGAVRVLPRLTSPVHHGGHRSTAPCARDGGFAASLGRGPTPPLLVRRLPRQVLLVASHAVLLLLLLPTLQRAQRGVRRREGEVEGVDPRSPSGAAWLAANLGFSLPSSSLLLLRHLLLQGHSHLPLSPLLLAEPGGWLLLLLLLRRRKKIRRRRSA